jgi:hypothetical protein
MTLTISVDEGHMNNYGILKIREQFASLLTRLLALAVVAMMLSWPSATSQSPPNRSNDCMGPTDNVLLMALQDPDNQSSYILVVKNRAKEPIVAFSVGDGAKPELHVIPFAVPSQIVGPAGWEGKYVFLEGSEFMHWVWSADNPGVAIDPGELSTGFKVVLPPFPQGAEKNVYSDGTHVRPVRLNELPFRAFFANGVCVWGHIRLLGFLNPEK